MCYYLIWSTNLDLHRKNLQSSDHISAPVSCKGCHVILTEQILLIEVQGNPVKLVQAGKNKHVLAAAKGEPNTVKASSPWQAKKAMLHF